MTTIELLRSTEVATSMQANSTFGCQTGCGNRLRGSWLL